MATDVPQRALRNETAKLLRRVENGERLRVTVHGHPVAELVPVTSAGAFVTREAIVAGLSGLIGEADEHLERELRELRAGGGSPEDPFR